MSRKITPIKDIISLFGMISLILREKPDIVHTHTPKAGIIGMLAAYICRVPHRLHTVAGMPLMEAKGQKKEMLFFIEKLTYSCATRVYPNSYGLEEYIVKQGLCPSSKLKVIGYGSSNGIDTDYFHKTDEVLLKSQQISKKYNLKEKFIFCFIGRVVKDKGIDELMYAFDKLTKEFSNISLLIVGNFEEKLNPISAKSHNILKNNNDIIHVGFQDDVRPYLALADCFVFPSYREGFPNAVLQAASMEVPSIVTDINGCNEIINHGKNGLIIEPKDKEKLYETMREFMADKELSKKLKIHTRDEMIKKYDRKQFHQYLLKEYHEVLKDG